MAWYHFHDTWRRMLCGLHRGTENHCPDAIAMIYVHCLEMYLYWDGGGRCISIGMGGGGVIGINMWNHAMLQMFEYRLTFASKLNYLTCTLFTMYCCIRVHHYNTTNAMQSNQSGSINHSVLKTQIHDSNNSKHKENLFHNILVK